MHTTSPARDRLHAFHAAHPDVSNADGEQLLKLPPALLDEHDRLLCAALTETYTQVVTRLAREWNAAAVDGRVSKRVAAGTFRQLEDAAERAGISQDDATDDLYDEINAGPVV